MLNNETNWSKKKLKSITKAYALIEKLTNSLNKRFLVLNAIKINFKK